MQDSTRHWTLHATVDEDRDMAAQFEKTIGVPVKYEMLYVGEWKQNLLLADRYGSGRVFLAGDAVHLMIPTGGLGMNSGVGDAIDLAWKLEGTLRGWGGPQLLASYESRAPPGRRAQRRGVALRLAGPAQVAQPVAQPGRAGRSGEGRAAQDRTR